MKCEICGEELDLDGKCPNCQDENQVRVITDRENSHYQGLTIDAIPEDNDDNTAEEIYEEEYTQKESTRTYSNKNFNGYVIHNGRIFGRSPQISKWKLLKYKILGGLILTVVTAILLIIALPVAAIGLVAALVAYLIYKFIL